MQRRTRREFISQVGKGMVLASVSTSLAHDLLPGSLFADEADRLTFGALEPLVGVMQDTPANRLLPILVERLRQGTDLKDLVAAAAFANARTFGGGDYVGFHTMMALSPAYHMAREMPTERQALPVLKVLFRNTSRIQEAHGGRHVDVLQPVQPAALPEGRVGGEVLREAVRRTDRTAAERTLAAISQGSAEDAFNSVLYAVQDGHDVHRVVLPYRAWDLMGVIGRDHAQTLLRQSVRFCINAERPNTVQYYSAMRDMLPRVLDQHRVLSRPLGSRMADDAWVDQMSQTLFRSTPQEAASAAAQALAEGMSPDAIGEAITLTANQLVLRDSGRRQNEIQPNKPLGSVHGDSIGVHASDSANAWRNMARVSNPRNTAVCLILGAYQVAKDRTDRGGDFANWLPYPRTEARAAVRERAQEPLLRELEIAIRGNDQARASAVAQAYGEAGHPSRAIFDLLLGHAIGNDGALHGEKYYRTCTEEFNATRAAFRWRHIVALARVTASAHGYAAPGHADACRLLQA